MEKRRATLMRKSTKEMINRKSIANLLSVDFRNFIEKESNLNEQEISRELGLSIGEVRYLKNKLLR